MFENIVDVSVFVKILVFAFISVFSINIVVGFISFCVGLYIKRKGL